MRSIKKLIFIVLILVFSTNVIAQNTTTKLTTKEQKAAIDSISKKLLSIYIFPEVAKKMSTSIQSNFKKNKYKSILDPQEFAFVLTKNLQEISKDLHLNVSFDPTGILERKKAITTKDSLILLNNYIDSLKENNFGFKEIKILDGNIGYLDLRIFAETEYGGETAISAMNFLSNTNTIIIDLRNNGGGDPGMIQLISSYLFDGPPVHLNNFYWRSNDSTTQTWTLPYVPGKKSPNKPVYILTSRNTFSAAEEFSYNLQNLKRATLIGETTGGGAHPGDDEIATDKFTVWVPSGRAISPITKTNWEGTGVVPHINTTSKKALDVAHLKALEVLLEKTQNPDLKFTYQWSIAALKAKLNPIQLDHEKLKSFVGNYQSRVITFKSGTLFYQKDNGIIYELLPYSNNEFMLKNGSGSFRIRFITDGTTITAMEGLYNNGHTSLFNKTIVP